MQSPEQIAPPQIEQGSLPPEGAVTDTAQSSSDPMTAQLQVSEATVSPLTAANEIPWQSVAVLHLLVQMPSSEAKRIPYDPSVASPLTVPALHRASGHARCPRRL
jgi:hypothetical protein